MRWTADGSAVFFSHGPVVFGAALDGAWARAVADASTRSDPRRSWPPGVQPGGVVGPMTSFDISTQGDRLVYATCAYVEEGTTGPIHGYEIAVVGLDGTPPERLTRNSVFDNYPTWSPDDARIAGMGGDVGRDMDLFVIDVDTKHRRWFDFGDHKIRRSPPQWSPDGTWLAFVGTDHSQGRLAVFTVSADGTNLRRVAHTISGPFWSPDGRRLAFVGTMDDASDAWDLLTVAADGTDVRRVPLAPDWAPHYAGGHVILTELSKFSDGWIPTLAWSPAGDHLTVHVRASNLRGGAEWNASRPVAD